MKKTKEERLKELLDKLFVEYFISLQSNQSPKDFIIYYNSKKEWLIIHDKNSGITDINYQDIWSIFEKEYNMKYKNIQSFIKNELLIPLNLIETMPYLIISDMIDCVT